MTAGAVIASLDVQRDGRILHALLRDDVDHAADSICTVLRARRTADDLDALDVLRTDAQQLVAVAVVFRLAAEHALPIHEQQRVAWVTAAN